MDVEQFIERWKGSGGSEMATAQSFAIDLTSLLDVAPPKVSDADGDFLDYRFERPVTETHTGRKKNRRIDLYKKGHFILEAKQFVSPDTKGKSTLELFLDKHAPQQSAPKQSGHGKRGTSKFDDTMLKARNQADNYARAISKEDGWPPFLIIVDVGHVIELYADFSGQGQGYSQFPDGNRYRIYLEDLRAPETLELLRAIWTDPLSLDPSLQSAKVTREIASRLAELGKSFEAQGHESEAVARFLMRCLFSMFAEDVELIPRESFTSLLRELRGHPEHAQPSLQGLWETMNKGGFSQVLKQDLKRFNGGLFKEADALPLDNFQLGLLIEAAEADWRQVEPAIFGTLLERALDKRQRHKLGAHYTPRSYVERLVTPTIMEPLREDWRDVQTAVQRLSSDGKDDAALKLVQEFHAKLCEIRVLDPACGSGNFLYVALEMMKRLEGEVTALLAELGEDQASFITIDPHQFLGIELNPWAANVAELVLWIGYLQWHFRTFGTAAPSEPVLRDFKNIKCADAVLTWEQRTPLNDETGNPVTRWDGVTTIEHNVTGEDVPDPNAKVPVYEYSKPSSPAWPKADYIVGNPPFIGLRNIRKAYADGYLEALRKAHPDVPENCDYVMYWWEKAAIAAKAYDQKKRVGTRRFGFITTNSITQSFNRQVTSKHLGDAQNPISLVFAVPNHPWVDSTDGASVRIAMSVGVIGRRAGELRSVQSEAQSKNENEGAVCELTSEVGTIYPDFRIGADLLSANPLKANDGLASVGFQLTGKGFLIDPVRAEEIVGSEPKSKPFLKPWLGGLGIQRAQKPKIVIDVCHMAIAELRSDHREIYQHIADTVLPERKENSRKSVRERWWVYGEARNTFRPALRSIERMIVTSLTASNRIFVFAPKETVADSTTVMFALDAGEMLAALSSRIHIVWATNAGARLGVGNDPRYNKSRCFDPFPFPELGKGTRASLRQLGEELDAHRKRQQAAHPKLTLTQMYNVLEKLRAGELIESKDKVIYDDGLLGILKDIHDQIDEAIADAYGWPADLSDEEILLRIVALNHQRSKEEARGHVGWIRPEYQNPSGADAAKVEASDLDLGAVTKAKKAPWPNALPEQIAAVREALSELGEATPAEVASRFKRARGTTVEPLLDSLAALGQAELIEEGRYAA